MSRGSRDLEQVRSELRRLGYLSDRFDRFLLQDAFRPQRSWLGIIELALRVGALVGCLVALVAAFALATANGNLERTPLDLVPLFLHLLVPATLLSGLAFLALCAVLVVVLRIYPVRRIETLSLTAALLLGAGVLGVFLWRMRDLLAGRPTWWIVLAALALLPALYAVIKLVSDGLLALAIRLTHRTPSGRFLSRRRATVAVLVAAFVPVLPALMAVNQRPPEAPPALPASPGERVVLIGIDGALGEEVDYLLSRGELPAVAALRRAGAGWFDYQRPDGPPADFWTRIATGVSSPSHGVTALDSFRPLGVATPLSQSGPLRRFWQGVEVPLGLAEYAPVLSNRRRVFSFWELASRGGAPVLAINWWTTFPAEELPGLVVSHGAYQMLAEGVAGVVAPASRRSEVEAWRGESADDQTLVPEVPAFQAVADRALLPDRFYRSAFRQGFTQLQPRAAAVYLSALDLAADGWSGGAVAFADLVRDELAAADRLIGTVMAELDGEPATVVWVVDPGRRGGAGRVLVARSGACRGARGEVAPEAVAASLLRALGLPQSGELPAPVAGCSWPLPSLEVASFGPRQPDPTGATDDEEYLESLRALGYL
ncbi:MAG: alkaline phosphatase family protein [Acidobacteriota bacterium]